MHTNLITGALPDGHETPISNSAAEIVRMGFNPSSLPKVDAIKGLAAALISECEALRDEGEKVLGRRQSRSQSFKRPACLALPQRRPTSDFFFCPLATGGSDRHQKGGSDG